MTGQTEDEVGPGAILEQLRQVFRGTQRFVSVKAAEADLSPLDYFALTRIEVTKGMSGVALGRELGLGRSSMTGLADRLEDAGLLRRRAHPTDRRVVMLTATAKGRRVVERSLTPVLSDLSKAIEKLSSKEQVAVSRMLVDVAAALERSSDSDATPSPMVPRIRTPSRRPARP
ncbi:MAG TPA: MarR family transcriptional regulator [Solirubrobacteraceae bacterium]|nr:MarR family transcriptional regulator [Solirubrobacteraceae bacterium]